MLRLLMKVFWWLLVRGWVPDWILRRKIRAGLQQMLDTMDTEEKDYGKRVAIEADFVRELRSVRLGRSYIELQRNHRRSFQSHRESPY